MIDFTHLKPCLLAGTLEHGGAERQLFYILRALRQAGAAPRLLSLDRGEFWEDKIRQLGVPVTCIGDQSSRMKRLVRVFREVRKFSPDFLQSQHFFANSYVGLTGRIRRLKSIGAMRNNGRSELRESGRFGGWLNLHTPVTIAANSRMAIECAVEHGLPASRLHFLPNVVDTDLFQPRAISSENPVTLIAVGRLVKQKRLDRFISILGRLRGEFGLNVKGLIVGPGCCNEDVRPELESQAGAAGLSSETLELRGAVSDMRPVYRGASVCVLTSDYEGTPNVLLEAMASGLPVVATRVGGVPEIVRHGITGLLFEPGDLEGMIAALVELLRNVELRTKIGNQARDHVKVNHSLERLPVYLSELYESALSLNPVPTRAAVKVAVG